MIYELNSSSKDVAVIGEIIQKQLVSLGNVPKSFIAELADYVSDTPNGLKIHSDQENRVGSGHVKISSMSQLKELMMFLNKRCFYIEYKGCYAFYYSDIELNNRDNEINIPFGRRFTDSSWFAFNIACGINSNNLFKFSVVISKEYFKNYSHDSYIKWHDNSEKIEYKISEIADFISSYSKKNLIDFDLEEFINICRREAKL